VAVPTDGYRFNAEQESALKAFWHSVCQKGGCNACRRKQMRYGQ